MPGDWLGAAGLAAPGDLWAFGASLDTLRDETGAVDQATVEGAVQELLKDRPGLRAQPSGDIGIGKGATAAAERRTEPKLGLSQLLKPGPRG